jgi:hypothetical protein
MNRISAINVNFTGTIGLDLHNNSLRIETLCLNYFIERFQVSVDTVLLYRPNHFYYLIYCYELSAEVVMVMVVVVVVVVVVVSDSGVPLGHTQWFCREDMPLHVFMTSNRHISVKNTLD